MLDVLGLNRQAEWLNIVKGFEDYDVYYFPQHAMSFHLHGDGEPLLFHYRSGGTKAVNVVMKRDISGCSHFEGLIEENAYFDIITPYGYGGFLIEGDASPAALAKLDEEYSDYCKSHGIVSEFVRFHPLLRNYAGMESIYEVTEMGRTVCIDLSSPEVINANIRPQTRNRLRKAQRDCIEVTHGNSKELFALFNDMYNETMDRNNADPYYYFGLPYFESVRLGLRDNATLFYTVCAGKIASMELVLFCGTRMHSHLQASRRDCQQFSPVPLMIYKEALWGCETGKKEYHLGGGLGSKEDNIFQFKSNFNQNSPTRFYTGRKIFDCDKYAQLVKLRRNESPCGLQPGFFPEYRA